MTETSDEQSVERIQQKNHPVFLLCTFISLACAFGTIVFSIKTTLHPLAIDLQIARAIQEISFPSFAWLMTIISWPGFNPQVNLIAGAIILVIYILGLRWEAFMALITILLSTIVNLLIKELIQRPRPEPTLVNVAETLNSYSFPSGHVMNYFCFLGFIGFLIFCLMRPSLVRTLLMTVIGLPIVLIGVSRIYLGQHWASDVLGAYLLGSMLLIINIQIYLRGKRQLWARTSNNDMDT